MPLFFALLYKLGVALRNPHLKAHFRFLMKTDRWSIDKLNQYQLEQCKELLIFAGKHSPYYREIFTKTGFRPENFHSLEQLKQLPVLEKKALITENSKIHSKFDFGRKLQECSTSGTSGSVLRFGRNEEWDSKNRAAQLRGYAWHGIKPWSRNGYLWGYNIEKGKQSKVKLIDFILNRFRIFTYEESGIRSFAKKLKHAKFLEGYSSMIYEVAKRVNALDLGKDINLLMVKGTSEKIYESYQPEVIKAFGKRMISEYGAAETGIIAFECPQGQMHINTEGVVVEVEDNEILVTNLLSYSFPIIRYRLGDGITLAPADYQCPCGRQHPVITDVQGRVGKLIHGQSGTYPSLTLYYIFKNIDQNHGIELNYQAHQNEKGKLLFKIEQEDEGHKGLIDIEVVKYFGNDIDYQIEFGQKLHTMDGKLKDFVTTID